MQSGDCLVACHLLFETGKIAFQVITQCRGLKVSLVAPEELVGTLSRDDASVSQLCG